MEPIEGSETSAFKPQTPGKYPKENILHKEHGESLKSRKVNIASLFGNKTPFCLAFRHRKILIQASSKDDSVTAGYVVTVVITSLHVRDTPSKCEMSLPHFGKFV